MNKHLLPALLLSMTTSLSAQLQNMDVHEFPEMEQSSTRKEISIPNIPGFETLKCDFHIHTVFSDGSVWPTVRIDEAWQNGLDAIALTDHIEYRPYKDIVLGDLNKSYEIAKKRADNTGMILIQGTEVTRQKPFGHMNALFITDANKMKVESPEEAIKEAKRQGGIIIWNHPGWPNDTCDIFDVHKQMIKSGMINAVEVHNNTEMYPKAMDWCNEMNIGFAACSDIHGVKTIEYGNDITTHPMTLVFAKTKDAEGIKEALQSKRTIAYFNQIIAGPEALIKQLVEASLKTKKINSKGLTEVTNISDIPFIVKYKNNSYRFKPGTTVRLTLDGTPMTFENCIIGAQKYLSCVL